jgi:hypothetical protein
MSTKTFVLACLAMAVPAAAHANEDAARKAGSDLDVYFSYLSALRDDASRYHGTPLKPAKDCHAVIATARKAGVGNADKIYNSSLRSLDEVSYDKDKNGYVTLAEAEELCTSYGKWLLIIPGAGAQKEAWEQWSAFRDQDPATIGAGTEKKLADQGKACVKATDAAIAAGAPSDWKTTIGDRRVSLAEGKTEICQAVIDLGASFAGKTGAQDRAKEDEIRQRYVKAGIKGARLELFVKYDNTRWMAKGCKIIYDDLKVLKKATALFQWWENADGSHTIRKYTFKGDKVTSVKDKTFATSAKASKGCK